MTGTTVAARLRISGRVQGVWYRAWTVETARRLGLRGWVRNRADGSVEALVIGDGAAVDEIAAQCRRGPPKAVVDAVECIADVDDGSTGFAQQPTL